MHELSENASRRRLIPKTVVIFLGAPSRRTVFVTRRPQMFTSLAKRDLVLISPPNTTQIVLPYPRQTVLQNEGFKANYNKTISVGLLVTGSNKLNAPAIA